MRRRRTADTPEVELEKVPRTFDEAVAAAVALIGSEAPVGRRRDALDAAFSVAVNTRGVGCEPGGADWPRFLDAVLVAAPTVSACPR